MFNLDAVVPSSWTNSIMPVAAMASTYTSLLMLRTMAKDFIPQPLQSKVFTIVGRLFASPRFSTFTLVIEEYTACKMNEIYEACESYLHTKIDIPSLHRLTVSKQEDQKSIVFAVAKDEIVVDEFEGISLTWKFITSAKDNNTKESRSFELTFCEKHKEFVINIYLPHVLKRSKAIVQENSKLELCSTGLDRGRIGGHSWGSIKHDHPATFDTLAMDEDLKKAIIQDLDLFLSRRDYYRKVGKAWKRGYLLYGPPGTGKSSLIAAMANYLKFNIYDLELTGIYSNTQLRNLLVAIKNRSIIVIEDIDCSVKVKDRGYVDSDDSASTGYEDGYSSRGLTLSGLLNCIDGLWSSCGEERIIIFTTNHKDKIDPALLRPGRMDVHIHMTYCTSSGFKVLASNYHDIPKENQDSLYLDIVDQIEGSKITPAEVAEELMRSQDADTALAGLHECLKRKRSELEEKIKGEDNKQTIKKQKSSRKNVTRTTRTRARTRGGRHVSRMILQS